MAKKSTDSTTKKTTTSTAAKKEPTTKASTTKTKELTMLFSEIEKEHMNLSCATSKEVQLAMILMIGLKQKDIKINITFNKE